MREKGGNRLMPGPDYMKDALKLPNQAPRVSGKSLNTCVSWRCPDGTHLFCWPILGVSGQSLTSNGPVFDRELSTASPEKGGVFGRMADENSCQSFDYCLLVILRELSKRKLLISLAVKEHIVAEDKTWCHYSPPSSCNGNIQIHKDPKNPKLRSHLES
ncbi:hypothetical protein TNCV_2115081 [Trichonephila clavipes]|nr:hypothetical protein TNCV_2115081 [Trichonephila clavipes]